MYEQQLCTFAHILERRHGQRVERLVLYWTAEEKKANAIMEFPYRPEMVAEAGRHFDEVVAKIEANDVHRVTRRFTPLFCLHRLNRVSWGNDQ